MSRLFIAEEKKLQPIVEKLEKYHEELQAVQKSINRTESHVDQIDRDTDRRDNGMRLEMADEQKQIKLMCEAYDEKIKKIMEYINDNK